MRAGWQLEHLGVCLATGLVSFCILDEEPLLDWSDLSLLHVGLLALCALLTYFDLTLRARWGQSTSKDTAVGLAAFTFIWGLENYVRVLLLVFALHNLMPLEIDLLEQVALYQSWGAWLVVELSPSMLLLGFILGLIHVLNLSLGARYQALTLVSLTLLCLAHLATALLLAWDLAVAGFSSISLWEAGEVFYLQPKTALTFDRSLGAADTFEWHRERGWPFSLRFEDLYFFVFQLLLVWDLLLGLFFWLCVWVTHVAGIGVSHTQLAFGQGWAEHTLLAMGFVVVGLGLIGWRVWSQIPADFGSSWL